MDQARTRERNRDGGVAADHARVIVRKASYDEGPLRETIFAMLDNLGDGRITAGTRVLVKPNLLSPSPPESAILTHPLVVKAVVEYVLSKGGRPVISDSQAMGSFQNIIKKGGFVDALRGLDAPFQEFRESTTVDVGHPFGKIELARDLLDADLVVNLPKLKTHSQMLLTLAVKNTFGCVAGLRKVEWHMKAGIDRDFFARLLVQINRAVAPSINILDGILALEGDGPGSGGTPRHLGIIMGSDSSVALDMTVCTILGISPNRLPTVRAAATLNLVPGSIDIEGTLPEVADFDLPEETALIYGPPRLQNLARKYILQRPVVDDLKCTLCGDCLRFCPADAIARRENSLEFLYEKCIRCYCCIEVCPQGALRARGTVAGRILQGFIR